ncbi:hypothetical protein AAG906_020042 [Vitis piasezkii]
MDLDDSPSKPLLQDTNKGHQMKTEDLRKRNMKILHSATDSTLVEEALRNVGVEPQFEVPLCVLPGEGSEENVISCWDLVETNGGSDKYRGEEWGSGLNDPQAVRGEKEDRWEESSLAKFSHFLGFSTEGLEKEILDFLIKIRKRRERIHGKVLLEKSKFERELKRLECSVNYEKGRKQKDPSQGKGCQITVGVVRSLGSRRFLDWRALDASGVFMEFMDLSLKRKGSVCGKRLGRSRPQEDPWCKENNFSYEEICSIVDELGLMDIPRKGSVYLEWGPNNQSWARLDRGWWSRRGPSPFRFENMWLKKLKVWNKEVFGNLGCNKAAALQQVEFWDLVESERILSVEETELKKEAKENYKKWVLLEETHWRQLSREIWLRKRDRNTGSEGRSGNCLLADAFKRFGLAVTLGGAFRSNQPTKKRKSGISFLEAEVIQH